MIYYIHVKTCIDNVFCAYDMDISTTRVCFVDNSIDDLMFDIDTCSIPIPTWPT